MRILLLMLISAVLLSGCQKDDKTTDFSHIQGNWILESSSVSYYDNLGNKQTVLNPNGLSLFEQISIGDSSINILVPVQKPCMDSSTRTGDTVLVRSFMAQRGSMAGIKLQWETHKEISSQVEYYNLLRSRDGFNFCSLYKIKAVGIDQLLKYLCRDSLPNPGLNYYKLEANYIDGSKTETQIVVSKMQTEFPLIIENNNLRFDSQNPIQQFLPEISIARTGESTIRLQAKANKLIINNIEMPLVELDLTYTLK